MYDKIIALYPELKDEILLFVGIILQDEGNGVYIAQWNHPTLPRPTDEELA